MVHPMPVCAQWLAASGRRTGFRAEIYEWQIAALAGHRAGRRGGQGADRGRAGGEPPAVDTRRVTRLEQELRAVALDNAFGRMTDEVYLRRKSELATQIEAARRPESAAHTVDPKRALGYLDDLRSLWDVELPESPEHQDVRHEYERRRAQATAAGFERLEVLGPVIVEAKLSADPMGGWLRARCRCSPRGPNWLASGQTSSARSSMAVTRVSPFTEHCRGTQETTPENSGSIGHHGALVGARGFEPPTSSSRTMRATKLRHAPTESAR